MNLFIEVINCNDCNGVREICDHHSETLLNSAVKKQNKDYKRLKPKNNITR